MQYGDAKINNYLHLSIYSQTIKEFNKIKFQGKSNKIAVT